MGRFLKLFWFFLFLCLVNVVEVVEMYEKSQGWAFPLMVLEVCVFALLSIACLRIHCEGHDEESRAGVHESH